MATTREIPESHFDVLDAKCYASVATLLPDGRISNNVVVLLRDGQEVAFSVPRRNQKYRNLSADPRITLCVMHPDDPLKYLEIRGEAKLEDDADRSFVNRIAQKYMGRDEYPEPAKVERVTVRIVIDQVRAENLGG